MKLNPIPQRNSTNRASIILYNNAKSFTISFMKFSVYEWSVAHATDYNLTRVIGLELRVEGKKRGCFHLDCRKEMPNCWTPIDRSTRANEPYAITGRAKSATLRNLQVASTPRRKHGCTKRRCLIYYIGFLSRSNDSWKKKKEKGKGCEIFVTILSIFLIFFLFFSRMDYKFFSSHPFPEREVAALKFLPFQRAHLFASGIPIVIREPTVRQSGQHRYVSVNRDSCTHHKNPSRR